MKVFEISMDKLSEKKVMFNLFKAYNVHINAVLNCLESLYNSLSFSLSLSLSLSDFGNIVS